MAPASGRTGAFAGILQAWPCTDSISHAVVRATGCLWSPISTTIAAPTCGEPPLLLVCQRLESRPAKRRIGVCESDRAISAPRTRALGDSFWRDPGSYSVALDYAVVVQLLHEETDIRSGICLGKCPVQTYKDKKNYGPAAESQCA